MDIGKYSPTVYSPTVTAAYSTQSDWHRKLCNGDWVDDEGYDKYGYHKHTDKDRAGYTELDYLGVYATDGDSFEYTLLQQVYQEWTFDGVRPVKRKE